jgi:hypothetical protein
MYLKILNGTPKFGASLCTSCNHVTHIKGHGFSQEMQFCNITMPGQLIPFPVSECSDYASKRDAKLADMEKTAWILNIKGGRHVGFVRPDKFKEEHPDEQHGTLTESDE